MPFIINTNDLRIKVLGTKFNLSARPNDAEVQLSLEEGHVSLLSLLSKDEKEIFASQQAVLDKSTGSIPSNNLLEALEIIKLSYHLNYTLLENKVAFVKE